LSGKYDSLNKCTQEISESIKLHIQGVCQNAHEFIKQLAHSSTVHLKSSWIWIILVPDCYHSLILSNTP